MGLTYDHALGHTRRVYCKIESTPGTALKPATTDALNTTSFQAQVTRARKQRNDSYQQFRDHLASNQITGRDEYKWSLETYVCPSGTAGTAPDLHPLLYAALNGYTNTPATSDAYTQGVAQALKTVGLTANYGCDQGAASANTAWLQEALWGCWVEEMGIKIQGGQEPMVTFAGGAMGYMPTGMATIDGIVSSSDQIAVHTAEANMIGIGSVIQIGSDDNSGAGYRVTAYNSGTGKWTIDTSGSFANDAVVRPFAPDWPASSPAPLSGLVGSLTWDSLVIPVTAADISIKTNNKGLVDESFVNTPSELVPGIFEITGTLNYRIRYDQAQKILNRKAFGSCALTLVCGSTAGSIMTVSCPYCEAGFAPFEAPFEGEMTYAMPFTALGSAGCDAISITFT